MMKKSIVGIVGIVVSFLGLTSAQAIEVDEYAPCVVLEHVKPTGESLDHCIRGPKIEGQFVALEFFSIHCSACQANLPNINRITDELREELTVRMVSVDRNERDVRNYIRRNQNRIPHDVALDSSRDARNLYRVRATPTLFILDQSNTVIFKHVGVLSEAKIQEIIKKIRN